MRSSPLLPDPLAETLVGVAEAAAGARDRWWIVGSAAASLWGADVGVARDVDLLMSRRDASRLLEAHRGVPGPGAEDALFRSEVFGCLRFWPLAVDVMGALHLRSACGWQPVCLRTREPVAVAGAALFVPSRVELVRLFRRFGREKDLARASALAEPGRAGRVGRAGDIEARAPS